MGRPSGFLGLQSTLETLEQVARSKILIRAYNFIVKRITRIYFIYLLIFYLLLTATGY